ncbi:hypothetical protein V5N11_014456 [Cardamine amara subsp. amara]|uniref:Uncharacterized protein n=1 Tax=Cardamine amara subsp. amara TaxID=228776 RepID=A0ABD0Z2S7_CARAN
MDNVVNGNDVNAGNEDNVNEDRENVSRNKIVAIERPMDNDVGDWLDCRDEYNELPRPVEERQLAIEWEDGTGLEIGQEFCTREALRDLINRAANKNCFGFITVKSDP